MTHRRWLALALIAALLLSGCGRVASGAAQVDVEGRQVRAVATIGMIADVVEQVGGERVTVVGLMGPGVDPHLYKASEGDVIRLAEADIVFYNGLHLEAKMAEVFERMQGRTRTVAVTDGIPRDLLLAPPAFAGAYDPHVWFDVSLWMYTVEAVRDALIDLDPGSADLYRANADRYLAELADLHAYVTAQAERIPPQQRVLITAHDAFNYFGRAYGFEVRGLQGISTASEASTADVQNLAEFIVARRIPAIFIESSIPRRNVEAVQAAVEARGYNLQIGGELYSDALGDPGSEAGTYSGMLRHNVDTIVGALLGE